MEKLKLDALVEQVRRDLREEASNEQVREAVTELVAKYHDAKVKSYIPIIIHQEALKQLNANLGLASHNIGKN
ncbi:MAG: hypothetical protein GY803_11275 [Chloroflexi bacterium]|nr:hypothetical protein [Chloroflexota bacterium]